MAMRAGWRRLAVPLSAVRLGSSGACLAALGLGPELLGGFAFYSIVTHVDLLLK